jgi:hypothetical protein
MNIDAYKQALDQAKVHLAEATKTLAEAQETAAIAEGEIVELRQTIAALAKLCGESEFVEEDALGLTDSIRLAFKTSGKAMTAQDVKAQLESMGYGGRWGNVLASIHTVIKRLHEKGEIQATGNLNGRDTFRWKESTAHVPADHPLRKLRWTGRQVRGTNLETAKQLQVPPPTKKK